MLALQLFILIHDVKFCATSILHSITWIYVSTKSETDLLSSLE